MKESRKLLIGAVIAVMIFIVLISLIGADDFIDALGTASTETMLLLLVTAVFGIAMMGSSFHAISQSLEFEISWIEAVALYTGISLSHNLTPFGQAGGEPVGAAIVSRRTDRPYETCLAAISTFDVVNVIPALLVFVFGGLYVAVFDPTLPNELRPYLAAFSVFVVAVVSIFIVIYRHPTATKRLLERIVIGLNRCLAYIPLATRLDSQHLDKRLRGYTGAIGTVARDRPTILKASVFATAAFTAWGVMLWLALIAMDIHVSVMVAIVIVPVSLLASIVPLPGSGGGIEAVQMTLILVLTGATFAPALTAVVLSRGLIYWLPILLGTVTIYSVYYTD